MLKNPRSSYLLRQAQLANYQQLDKVVQAFGLTPSQYMVLGIISDHPDGIFSAALARRLGVAPQSSNEIVAGLERLELICRSEDPAHRPVLRLSLTAKGRTLLAKCEKAVDRFERDVFSVLSPGELARFRDMLARLIRLGRGEEADDEPAAARPRRAAIS